MTLLHAESLETTQDRLDRTQSKILKGFDKGQPLTTEKIRRVVKLEQCLNRVREMVNKAFEEEGWVKTEHKGE